MSDLGEGIARAARRRIAEDRARSSLPRYVRRHAIQARGRTIRRVRKVRARIIRLMASR